MKYENVLVTGGAGFIGSFLVERFLNEGAKVTVVDDLSRGSREHLKAVSKDITFFDIGLGDSRSIGEITTIIDTGQIDLIVHYAAVNGTMHFYDNALRTARVNSIATSNLLNAIENTTLSSVKKFSFASTSEVYGEPTEVPTSESALTYSRIEEVRDSYSSAKMMSEFYVKLWCEQFGVSYNLFRIFNVYGPRMVNTKYGQVIPEFIKRINDGESPLIMVGDGANTRSFCYIDDHVEMVYRVINSEFYDNEVINIGNDIEISIRELAKKIQEIMGIKINLESSPPREGDILRRCPDISFFRQQNPDFSFCSLEEGLEKSIEYYKS